MVFGYQGICELQMHNFLRRSCAHRLAPKCDVWGPPRSRQGRRTINMKQWTTPADARAINRTFGEAARSGSLEPMCALWCQENGHHFKTFGLSSLNKYKCKLGKSQPLWLNRPCSWHWWTWISDLSIERCRNGQNQWFGGGVCLCVQLDFQSSSTLGIKGPYTHHPRAHRCCVAAQN